MNAVIAILGSGFAGSILARLLALQGHQVVLLERARHPRFAIGESSTPLAALALERLAARYGLDDLDSLAAYGRWMRDLPHLRRGLKRGFTFYAHEPGIRYANTARDERRLLVAASPNDEIADTHWLRADVDQHLARAAAAAGADLHEETEVVDLARRPGGGFRLELRAGAPTHREPTAGERRGPVEDAQARENVAACSKRDPREAGSSQGGSAPPRVVDVDHVIDGTGRRGVIGRRFAAARRVPIRLETTLLAAHLEGVVPFDQIAPSDGAVLEPGPYPDHRAAVHHLLREGWVYVLPFDHGTSSVGIVAHGTPPPGAREDPEAAFRAIVSRYPTLAESLAGARAAIPYQCSHPLPHRCRTAAGAGWALLPHTYAFYDPLFSAGIAWSLLAVERLADWGEALRDDGPGEAQRILARYARLLAREADHLEALVVAAWRAMPDFDRFVAQSFLYFATASFSEARQRLCPEQAPAGGWAWSGFLGATDRRIAAWPRALDGSSAADILASIAPRNVAGLGDPAYGRRVPVAIEPLLAGARKLGLSRKEARARASRLRGWTATS